MESTDKRGGRDRSSRLNRTGERGVLREGEMGAGAVIVVGIGPEDLAKVCFAQVSLPFKSSAHIDDGARRGKGWS
jgi:hypothetical protein